eukprot:TRINITY_DN7622_c0_g1_i1.p1 TRINITY_DN7622_c0_g1~~TRINITY_DN7622_c0_g1_i1.p1  ORF type:complete len:293 (-),score=59.28 TRINITY_DN7622_c0_g1_i1:18-836(-)
MSENVLQLFNVIPNFEYRTLRGAHKKQALVVKYYEGGPLKDWVSGQSIDELRFYLIALGIAKAVLSLHEHHIIHKDISLKNFITSKDGDPVITSFTLAHFIPDVNSICISDFGESVPWRWSPPETLNEPHLATKASDIYMCGITFWELLCPHKIPFDFVNDARIDTHRQLSDALHQEMVQNHHEIPLNFPTNCPLKVRRLIEKCCAYGPENRLTVHELLRTLTDLFNTTPKSTLRQIVFASGRKPHMHQYFVVGMIGTPFSMFHYKIQNINI